MSVPVNEVINIALRIIRAEKAFSGENYDAREYALTLLNNILFTMNETGQMLPYEDFLYFDTVAGQNSYTIGSDTNSDIQIDNPIIALTYVNLIVNQYEYYVQIEDEFGIYSNIITPTISGRPRIVLPQYEDNFIRLTFYPNPDRVYQIRLRYKPQLLTVNYQGTIPLPRQYEKFLCLQLARDINSLIAIGTWADTSQAEYEKELAMLKSAAFKDNRVRSAPPIRHFYLEFAYFLGVLR